MLILPVSPSMLGLASCSCYLSLEEMKETRVCSWTEPGIHLFVAEYLGYTGEQSMKLLHFQNSDRESRPLHFFCLVHCIWLEVTFPELY